MRNTKGLGLTLLWGTLLSVGLIFPGVTRSQSTTNVDRIPLTLSDRPQSESPALSADGRYVAFESQATNLVPSDDNAAADIFIYDRQTGSTERVSVSLEGGDPNGPSGHPALSADGRYVAFESQATNLVSGDHNSIVDIFIHDRQTGSTERVSVNLEGGDSDGHSFAPSLSADGQLRGL